MEKIIFLDIDGVLAIPESRFELSASRQELLRIILEKTDAKIVLSSSWRKHDLESTIEYMKSQGFLFTDKMVGVTVRAYHLLKSGENFSIQRGSEIHNYVSNYLIYPWIAYPDQSEKFSIYKEDGSFKCMRSQQENVHFTYVILDDDNDMLLNQKKNFIRCNMNIGLTMANVNKAIEILNKTKF